jgi:hypothetical protein
MVVPGSTPGRTRPAARCSPAQPLPRRSRRGLEQGRGERRPCGAVPHAPSQPCLRQARHARQGLQGGERVAGRPLLRPPKALAELPRHHLRIAARRRPGERARESLHRQVLDSPAKERHQRAQGPFRRRSRGGPGFHRHIGQGHAQIRGDGRGCVVEDAPRLRHADRQEPKIGGGVGEEAERYPVAVNRAVTPRANGPPASACTGCREPGCSTAGADVWSLTSIDARVDRYAAKRSEAPQGPASNEHTPARAAHLRCGSRMGPPAWSRQPASYEGGLLSSYWNAVRFQPRHSAARYPGPWTLSVAPVSAVVVGMVSAWCHTAVSSVARCAAGASKQGTSRLPPASSSSLARARSDRRDVVH